MGHTVPFKEQRDDLRQPREITPDPVPTGEGDEYVVEKILNHRKRGRGYQFLTLWKGSPEYDAEWQPSRDFIDDDGTMNDKFLSYIKAQNILEDFWKE